MKKDRKPGPFLRQWTSTNWKLTWILNYLGERLLHKFTSNLGILKIRMLEIPCYYKWHVHILQIISVFVWRQIVVFIWNIKELIKVRWDYDVLDDILSFGLFGLSFLLLLLSKLGIKKSILLKYRHRIKVARKTWLILNWIFSCPK